jgi:hypothetical protein
MLFLTEREMDKAWEPSKKQRFLVIGEGGVHWIEK